MVHIYEVTGIQWVGCASLERTTGWSLQSAASDVHTQRGTLREALKCGLKCFAAVYPVAMLGWLLALHRQLAYCGCAHEVTWQRHVTVQAALHTTLCCMLVCASLPHAMAASKLTMELLDHVVLRWFYNFTM